MLARHRIFTQLDFHQDLYNERFSGEGFPDWAVIDDGVPAEPLTRLPGQLPVEPGPQPRLRQPLGQPARPRRRRPPGPLRRGVAARRPALRGRALRDGLRPHQRAVARKRLAHLRQRRRLPRVRAEQARPHAAEGDRRDPRGRPQRADLVRARRHLAVRDEVPPSRHRRPPRRDELPHLLPRPRRSATSRSPAWSTPRARRSRRCRSPTRSSARTSTATRCSCPSSAPPTTPRRSGAWSSAPTATWSRGSGGTTAAATTRRPPVPATSRRSSPTRRSRRRAPTSSTTSSR